MDGAAAAADAEGLRGIHDELGGKERAAAWTTPVESGEAVLRPALEDCVADVGPGLSWGSIGGVGLVAVPPGWGSGRTGADSWHGRDLTGEQGTRRTAAARWSPLASGRQWLWMRADGSLRLRPKGFEIFSGLDGLG